MSKEICVAFAGSPDFAVPSLDALCDADFRVQLVLTQPDRPAGRGRKIKASPVKLAALKRDLKVSQPEDVNDPRVLEQLKALRPDVMVVAAYGQILGADLLTLPAAGCVNVHASLLPRWRGASPVQAAILAGDQETGVSLMAMERGLDTGPVFDTVTVPLDGRETGESLHDELAARGAQLLIKCLPGIVEGGMTATAQPEEGVSYAPRLSRRDSAIDWSRSALEIERQIRAMNPWPVADTLLDGQPLRCWFAQTLNDSAKEPPGTVLGASSAGIDVATGVGIVRLLQVQRAGRRVMDAATFVRGCDMDGKVLGY